MSGGEYIGGTQPLLRYVKLSDDPFKCCMFGLDAVDGAFNRHVTAIDVGAARPPRSEKPNVQAVMTIGVDIAKSVFQAHGMDAEGKVVVR